MLGAGGPALAKCDEYLAVEFWADGKGRIAGIEGSVFACPHDFDEYRVGYSIFAFDDVYEGISGSARLRVGDVVSAFAGVGLLVGRADRDADSDGIDNDGDGAVDEAGEEDSYSLTAFAYPEAGLAFHTPWIGLTLSTRKFFGEDFNGDIIYSAGISWAFGGD